VDWTLAFSTAARLVRPGPTISAEGAAAAVADLRRCAGRAEAYVAEVTGLLAPGGTAPVLVVDRPGWIQANLDAFREVLAPLNAKAVEKLASGSPWSAALGSRVTGLEVGALLSYLAPKVLGQFDPFYPGEPGGRLLLVAPNVVEVERQLGVDARDFRLWVCLHEQTHRVQFHAVPWLRAHLESEVAAFVDATDLDPSAMAARIKGAIAAVRRSDGSSLLEAMQTPQQREVLDRMQALMSLLEGHADQVMDAVGPQVVPSVASIRRSFEARRDGGSPVDRFIRRLLGLDMKMQQYRQGGAFVRAIVDEVGVDAFNQVWTSPETLPTRAEIAAPKAWMSRVLDGATDDPAA
jgi:coenzyme F420 biosynthesis associated uncharacterized protein